MKGFHLEGEKKEREREDVRVKQRGIHPACRVPTSSRNINWLILARTEPGLRGRSVSKPGEERILSLSLSRVTRMNPRCERSSNRPWNIDWPRCVAFEPGLRSRGVASKTERAKRERALYAATTFYPARNWLNEWPSMLDGGE